MKSRIVFVLLITIISITRLWAQSDSTFKKTVSVLISAPWLNAYFLTQNSSNTSVYGFIGFAGELNYHFKHKNYFVFKIGNTFSSKFPFPASVHHARGYEKVESIFINLFNCHSITPFVRKSMDYGYGIHFARYSYEKTQDDLVSAIKNSIGISSMLRFHIFTICSVGLSYNPSLYNLEVGKLEYNHFTNIELVFKIIEKKSFK